MRFLGRSEPKIDEKGRLVLPAKYRESLKEGVVITAGQEDCLQLYTAEAFDAKSEAMAASPATDAQARGVQRIFFSSAEETVPDKQGRVSIAPHLRQWAGLDKRTVVVGVGGYIEIWDADRWESHLDVVQPTYSALDTREL